MLESLGLTSFESFGLAAPIARALAEENYTVPTPIQAQTVPLALTGRDIVGIAQTGTGKTAAFALPILHQLSTNRTLPERKCCRVLVLSPTRELSSQILDSFRAYGRHLGITATLAIGGVTMGKQVRALMNGVDILVATPGRLLDLVNSNALRLNKVEFLVLDEADRMLDMGFIHDIRKIVAKLPAKRQTLFFSATMPQAIADLAGAMLQNPAKVAVTPVASTVDRVYPAHHSCGPPRQTRGAGRPAARRADRPRPGLHPHQAWRRQAVRGLVKVGIEAEAIHGNKSQSQRERVLAAFRQGQVRILIATDIAARGIDVDGISHVFNYDLPNEPESYVHRIGRTARAGASGSAISLCDADETAYLRAIEKLIRMTLPATDRRTGPVRPALPAAPAGDHRASHGHERHRGGGRRNGQPQRGQPSANRAAPHREKSNPVRAAAAPALHPHGNQPAGDLGRVAFLNRDIAQRRDSRQRHITDRPE